MKISWKKQGILLLHILLWMSMTSCSAVSQQVVESESTLPSGQRKVDNFPILRIGDIPELDEENWSLTVTGTIEDSATFTYNQILDLDTVQVLSDFHCVTGWSHQKNRWTGVLIRTFLEQIKLNADAKFLSFLAADGYSTSLPISECLSGVDMLAFRWEGKRLDNKLGGPIRAVIPEKYGYKSAMWLTEIRVTVDEELGYWEKRGYNNSADPKKEERMDEHPTVNSNGEH
ncbi:molybdopterin-dependent oxidoreductase [candidate division KSB1 bacterium]|nr:molybdopterin-dependent oxidoreductase [candidate division KSB1 bacterium]